MKRNEIARVLTTNFDRSDYTLISEGSRIIATFGMVANVLFYFICSMLGFKEYFLLRILAVLSFIPLILVKEKVPLFLKIILEICLAFSLPFLFSYLYYSNQCNTYWNLSLLVAGFIYGVLSGRIFNCFITFPLSCVISFVIFSINTHSSSLLYFYTGVPVIIISMVNSVLGFLYKVWITELVFRYIQLNNDSCNKIENEKIMKVQQERLSLEKKLYNSIRTKSFDTLSLGVLENMRNDLKPMVSQLTDLEQNENDINRKEIIRNVSGLANDALKLSILVCKSKQQ